MNGLTGKIKNTHEILFYIRSTSKQFTSKAVIKLIKNGVIRSTDSLKKFFINVPKDKIGITIHQLLTQTSGLDMYHETDKGSFEKIDRKIALERILNHILKYEPGKSFSYSNSGYVLLAIIIEQVTKSPYKSYIRDSFLKSNNLNCKKI